MRRRVIALLTVVFVWIAPNITVVTASTDASDERTADLLAKARAAWARGNLRQIDRLVSDDRFAAFEAVDELLVRADAAEAPLTQALAHAYARVHEDTALIERIAVFESWTPAELAFRKQADELKARAKESLMAGRFEESMTGYERALSIYQKLGDLREVGRCQSNLGAVALNHGDSRRALELLEAALPTIRRAGDRNMIGVVEINRAYALDDAGRSAEALDALEKALAIARETRDTELESRVLVNRGTVIMLLGRVDEAAAAFQDAALSGERAGDFELAGTAWINVASIDRLRGDTPSQERHLWMAVAAGRKGKIPSIEGNALLGIAPIKRREGDRAGEREVLDRCRSVLEHTDDIMQHSYLALQEALHLSSLNRLRDALPYLDLAERGLNGLDQPGPMALIIGTRASIFYYLGEYDKALLQTRAALDTARAGNRPDLEADHQATLGYLLHALGDAHGGLEAMRAAAEIHGKLGDIVSRGNDLDAVGFFRLRAGDLDGAREALEEAREALPEEAGATDRGEVFKDLALVELASGPSRQATALDLLRQAREAFASNGDRMGGLDVRLIEAQEALDRSDLPAAREIMRGLVADPSNRTITEHAWKLFHLEGRLAEMEGQTARAAGDYRRAIQEVERLRGGVRLAAGRAAILEDRITPYRALGRLLRAQGRIEEAYQVARSAKARTFVESLAPPDLPARAAGGAEAEGIAKASLIIPRSEKPADPYGSPVSSERLRSLLQEGEILLDFQIENEEMVVFVLSREQLSMRTSRLGKDVLQSFRATWWPGRPRTEEAQVTAAWQSACRQVGSALFEPLARDIEPARALLLVPGGPMHGIPLAALDYRGSPLFEHAEISILPAAEAILSRTKGRRPGGVLAVAQPDPRERAPLPFAVDEVRLVASQVRNAATVLEGPQASESAFTRLAPRAELIHVAAHGVVDPLAPMRSHVLLAADGLEDGRLEAAEIAMLHLTASLVVLSGCSTGVEEGLARGGAPADERMGLPRAFLTSGVGAVVAGLWEMQDEAAAAIMPRLYRGMPARSPARALADLQKEMAHGRLVDRAGRPLDHPYYWAGLVAYGAGREPPPRGPSSAAP